MDVIINFKIIGFGVKRSHWSYGSLRVKYLL